MCSGLTADMLEAIGKYNGTGIKFICTRCRLDFSVKRGGSPTSSTEMHLVELVKHLSQQVMGICSVVQQLKSELTSIRSQPEPVLTNQTILHPPGPVPISNHNLSHSGNAATMPGSSPPSSEYRKVVREELRELQEQQKRRSSLVIRGLGASSASSAITAFEHVSEFLTNQKVTLTDVVRIPSESDLFRGKVTDDATRRLILEKAKMLKDTARFGSVFIRRDLTFKQRSDLKAKRDAASHSIISNIPIHRQPQGPSTTPSVPDQAMVDTIPKCVDSPQSN